MLLFTWRFFFSCSFSEGHFSFFIFHCFLNRWHSRPSIRLHTNSRNSPLEPLILLQTQLLFYYGFITVVNCNTLTLQLSWRLSWRSSHLHKQGCSQISSQILAVFTDFSLQNVWRQNILTFEFKIKYKISFNPIFVSCLISFRKVISKIILLDFFLSVNFIKPLKNKHRIIFRFQFKFPPLMTQVKQV